MPPPWLEVAGTVVLFAVSYCATLLSISFSPRSVLLAALSAAVLPLFAPDALPADPPELLDVSP